MAELMREIAAESSPAAGADAAGVTAEDKAAEAKFRKAWEEMLVGEMNGVTNMEELLGTSKEEGKAAAGASSGKDKGKTKGFADDDFQKSIRKAMEKLKESETNLQVCRLS